MSIYRAILRQALKITWSYKYLWFFGIFAIALTVSGGEFNMAANNYSRVADASSFLEVLHNSQGTMMNFGANFHAVASSFSGLGLILLIVLLLLLVFFIWLATVSQGGLFGTGYKIFKKQNVGFGDTFAIGRQNFWRVLWLNILSRLFIYVLWLIIGVPLAAIYLSNSSEAARSAFIILSFVILIPLAIIVTFLTKYAVLFVVSKKAGVKAAIAQAWRLFVDNWLVSIEMAIIMFFVNIVTVIALVLVVMIFMLPLAVLIFLFGMMNLTGLIYLTILLALIVLTVMVIWVGAMLSVFHHIAWAFLYVRISEGRVLAKLVRIFGGRSLPPPAV